jgi:hypothetical protein
MDFAPWRCPAQVLIEAGCLVNRFSVGTRRGGQRVEGSGRISRRRADPFWWAC